MFYSGTIALRGSCFIHTRPPLCSNRTATSSSVSYDVKKAPLTRVVYLPRQRQSHGHNLTTTNNLSDLAFPPELDTSSLISNEGINFDSYDNIPVEANGKDVPPAVSSFFNIDLGSYLETNIKHCGYSNPTPVQKHAIPIIMAGRDLMASAQTGSGKTAAFCIPIIAGILKGQGGFSEREKTPNGSRTRAASPAALIICPTRELAGQIHDEVKKFAQGTRLRVNVAYGGVPIFQQMRTLERGVDILVATPGRLVDLIDRAKISLQKVQYLVLDEGDRMLDMGFEPQIRRIVEQTGMPPSSIRQTMLFSATLPSEIQRLASDFLSNYIYLTVGKVGSSSDLITQKVVDVSSLDKRSHLVDILRSQSMNAAIGVDPLTLVFVERKKEANLLEHFLYKSGFLATSIHGDRSQREREQALSSFKRGRTPILVATDVAARGLDVPNVAHVINYDLPKNIDSYVHRIGRTGRAGKSGLATSFFGTANVPMAKELADVMKEAKQEVPEWLLRFGGSRHHGYSDKRRKPHGYSDRRREHSGYSDKRRENHGYSDRRRENNGYSEGRRENNGYSEGRRENNGYSDGRRENNGYSDRRRENNGYSDGRRENLGYPDRRRENHGYSDRRREWGM